MEVREFLGQDGAKMFELLHAGRPVGKGGYKISATTGKGELVAAEIEEAYRGQGLGRYLVMFRLKKISEEAAVEWVEAEVPESVLGFYLKQGFRPVRESMGGSVRVAKRLAVCA